MKHLVKFFTDWPIEFSHLSDLFSQVSNCLNNLSDIVIVNCYYLAQYFLIQSDLAIIDGFSGNNINKRNVAQTYFYNGTVVTDYCWLFFI